MKTYSTIADQLVATPQVAVRTRREASVSRLRRLARSYVWLLATLLTWYGIVATIIAVPFAAIMEVVDSDPPFIVQLAFIIMGAPVVLIVLLYISLPVAVATYILLLLISRRQGRRRSNELQSALSNEGGCDVFLYLRSFELAASTIGSRLYSMVRVYIFAPVLAVMSPWIVAYLSGLGQGYAAYILLQWFSSLKMSVIEEDLSDCIGSRGLFIAIGEKYDSFGAIKLIGSDSEWQENLLVLLQRATLVFLHPGISQHVTWEAEYILQNPPLREKTVWIMPHVSGFQWEIVRIHYRETLGAELPSHRPLASCFRIGPDLTAGDEVALSSFISTLKKILQKDDQLALDRLWTQPRARRAE
jgi:hypothetical protein